MTYSITISARYIRISAVAVVAVAICSLASFLVFPTAAHNDPPIISDTHIETHSDRIPRFCSPGTVTHTATTSGVWSAANTWDSEVPGAEAKVAIPEGVTVTYDANTNIPIDCIEVRGTLQWAVSQDTTLYINDIQIFPEGTLIIGSETNPIQASNTAEIVIRNTPLKTGTVENPGIDPQQFGQGLINLGTWRIHGAKKDQTFIRLASEPKAGDTTLLLEQSPTGWQVGDRLLIPDTTQLPIRTVAVSKAEEPTIAAIAGRVITLASPLEFDHSGARNQADGGVDFFPHVADLSRNVVIRSENTALGGPRGHTLSAGRADMDIRYAHFEELGRTMPCFIDNTLFDESGKVIDIGFNQIARYSIHTHHLIGPPNPANTGHQFKIVGNTVTGGLKWSITIHGSHFGLIQDNVVYNHLGPGIVTEDGSEYHNEFIRNFVVPIGAGEERGRIADKGRTKPPIAVSPDFTCNNSEANTRIAEGSPTKGFGEAQQGFWHTHVGNIWRDNVVANSNHSGLFFSGYVRLTGGRVPKFRGANPAEEGEYTFVTESKFKYLYPLLEMSGNELYANAHGLWWVWPQGCCTGTLPDWTEMIIRDMSIWHTQETGYTGWHQGNTTFDGITMRNDADVSLNFGGDQPQDVVKGFFTSFPTYQNEHVTLRDFDIQGFGVGIEVPVILDPRSGRDQRTLIENGFLKNGVNIRDMLALVNGPKRSILRNVRSETIGGDLANLNGVPNEEPYNDEPIHIWMDYLNRGPKRGVAYTQSSTLHVYDWQGQPGNNFQLFFKSQAADTIVPSAAEPDGSDVNGAGCPEAGLTNQQCWDKYGVAIAGQIAPCEAVDGDPSCSTALARAEALGVRDGLLFPFQGENPPPRVFAGIDKEVRPGELVSLTGFVHDVSSFLDGQNGFADASSRLPTQWTQVSGPSPAVLTNPSVAATTATFSQEGTYVLRLSATNGPHTTRDEVQIVVDASAASVAPTLSLTQPTPGSTISSSTIDVRYLTSGDLTGSNVDHIHFQLDTNPEVRGISLTGGTYTFTNVPPGRHTIKGYLAKTDHTKVPDTDVSVTFTVAEPTPDPTLESTPNTPPTISTLQDAYTVTLGDTLTFQVTAQDGDGDSLTLDIPNLSSLLPGALFE